MCTGPYVAETCRRVRSRARAIFAHGAATLLFLLAALINQRDKIYRADIPQKSRIGTLSPSRAVARNLERGEYRRRRRLFEHEIESYNTRAAVAEQFFPFDASQPASSGPPCTRHLSVPIISQLRAEPRGTRLFRATLPSPRGIKGGRENSRVSASRRRA